MTDTPTDLSSALAAIEALQATVDRLVSNDDQRNNQQGLQTQALRRILESKLDGADGAAADVVSLEGGKTSIVVTLGKVRPPS